MLQILYREEHDDGSVTWTDFGPQFGEPDEVVARVHDQLADYNDWFSYYVADEWTDEDGYEDREVVPLEEFMCDWDDEVLEQALSS